MNKRGQNFGYFGVGLMLSVIFFIMIVSLIEPIKDQVTTARDTDHLNCAAEGLTPGQESLCIITDWYLPAFIGTGIMVALTLIGYVKLREEQ